MIIDTHCHLDGESWEHGLDAEIARNVAYGVRWMLTQGTSRTSSARMVALAGRYAAVYAAVGVHPNGILREMAADGVAEYTPVWRESVVAEIANLAENPRVLAIGETGMDDYWKDVPLGLQADFLTAHLALARRVQKPVVLHCRECEPPLLAVLDTEFAKNGPIAGVLHSFSGDTAFLRRCLDLGLHISYSGSVTYKNRKYDALRETVALVPDGRLLLETDSPYLVPTQARKQARVNSPYLARFTAETLAALRGTTTDAILQLTAENAERLFLGR